MNIKDFIIKGEIREKEHKEPKKRTPTEYAFTIEYENDTDFILKRATKKTEKLLVCLVSQAQIYIKDLKDNTIEIVNNEDPLKAFKKGMNDVPNFQKLTWKPFTYFYYTGPISISSAFDNVIHHKEAVKYLANKKYPNFTDWSLILRYIRDPEGFGKTNEVVKMMRLVDDQFSTEEYRFETISSNIRNTNLTYNTINANIEIIKELGASVFKTLLQDTMFVSVLRDYHCDLKSFLKYVLYTIKYRNALEIGSSYGFRVYDYVDYLRMQTEMYGKVKEKYPLYWLSEKQMMITKYNKWRELRRIEGFDLGQEKMKEYEYEDDVYKVVVPLKSSEILDEAQQQQHCVASYVNSIARGETHIVFIRQRLNEEESCLTVQITPEAHIIQARGFQNRDLTELEFSFMKKWAEEKKLILEEDKIGVQRVLNRE